MTALNRNSIIRGPGCIYWGSTSLAIPTAGGIAADVDAKEFDVQTDADGEIDRRLADCEAKIAFTPVGQITANVLAALFPAAYRNPVRGTSAFGATDVPAVVHSTLGTKITFHSVAITKMPSLILSADKQVYGPCEATAIRANTLEWSAAAALYTRASAAYSAPAVASADVKMGVYTAAWGDLIAAIVSETGWTVDFTLNLTPDPIDGYGTNDYLLDSVGVIARCRPKNLSETLIDSLKVQGTGAGIGVSRRLGKNLVITGANLIVTLYDAILQKGPLVWRGVEVRAGEIAFAASRLESTGVYGALFDVAIPSSP